jgi:hypothetical protein
MQQRAAADLRRWAQARPARSTPNSGTRPENGKQTRERDQETLRKTRGTRATAVGPHSAELYHIASPRIHRTYRVLLQREEQRGPAHEHQRRGLQRLQQQHRLVIDRAVARVRLHTPCERETRARTLASVTRRISRARRTRGNSPAMPPAAEAAGPAPAAPSAALMAAEAAADVTPPAA